MLKNYLERILIFLGIEKEFDFNKNNNNKSELNSNFEEESSDNSNLYKVPKYLERVKF